MKSKETMLINVLKGIVLESNMFLVRFSPATCSIQSVFFIIRNTIENDHKRFLIFAKLFLNFITT